MAEENCLLGLKAQCRTLLPSWGRHLSFLLVHGADDPVCPPSAVDRLMAASPSRDKQCRVYEGLLHEVGPDGRIHATFNQTVARTGRLSSDKPNLHNIPVRSDVGRVFRTAFVPSPGRKLLVADYNQIELRCIAHLALMEQFSRTKC